MFTEGEKDVCVYREEEKDIRVYREEERDTTRLYRDGKIYMSPERRKKTFLCSRVRDDLCPSRISLSMHSIVRVEKKTRLCRMWQFFLSHREKAIITVPAFGNKEVSSHFSSLVQTEKEREREEVSER